MHHETPPSTRFLRRLILLLLLVNLFQAGHSGWYGLFLTGQSLSLWETISLVLAAVLPIYLLWICFSSPSPLASRLTTLRSIPISRMGRMVIGLFLVVQLQFLVRGETKYPFTTVEMFKHVPKNENLDPIVNRSKYYFIDEAGTIQRIDLRREHLRSLSQHLGWRYNNEYTFAANFSLSNSVDSYRFLLERLSRQHGITSLSVGVHQVDFRTGKVRFYPYREALAAGLPLSSIYLPPELKYHEKR